jgi:hypothetical protein
MKWKSIAFAFMIGGIMAMLMACRHQPVNAAVGLEIGGPPPVCEWGYYDYAPYACAPYGYWGPAYFYNGVFIGVGPWFGWGYNHGWGNHRFQGYYRWQNHEWGNRKWRNRNDGAGWRRDHARGEWHESGRGWVRQDRQGSEQRGGRGRRGR